MCFASNTVYCVKEVLNQLELALDVTLCTGLQLRLCRSCRGRDTIDNEMNHVSIVNLPEETIIMRRRMPCDSAESPGP